MKGTKKINWGVIGAGSIASAFAHSIKSSKNATLISVHGRSELKTNKFSKKFNIKAILSLEKFLSSKEIDAVYVATPHNTHFLYSMEAIQSKKHVLCEKPLSVNSVEAMILVNEARKNEVFLMEAFMYRVHPQTKNLLKLLQENFSGEEIKIQSSFGFKADVNQQHRLRNPDLAGGAILDVGCYPLSMSRLIAGAMENKNFLDPLQMEVSSILDETGIDLNATAKIVFSKKIEAEIKTAINEELTNDLVIMSKEKKIEVKQPWHCGQFENGNSSIRLSQSKRRK